MFRLNFAWIVVALAALASHCLTGAERLEGKAVKLRGDVIEHEQISAVARAGNLIAIAADEGALIQILRTTGDDELETVGAFSLDDDESVELDLEGLAAQGNTLYAIGAHCATRKAVSAKDVEDQQRKHKKNLERLRTVETEPSRYRLFRFEINEDGTLDRATFQTTSLKAAIDADPILARFAAIPSKENGVDIEGIAVKDNKMYCGFRGPVLREQWVPVLVAEFDSINDAALRFVNLDGLGIRDITAVDSGFLILAGPVGDGPGGYCVYHWDGLDCVPGTGSPGGKTVKLHELQSPASGKAEGITVLKATESGWQVLIVFDGMEHERDVAKVFAIKSQP